MDQKKLEQRIANIQEYIDIIATLSAAAPTEERKTQLISYWGFAMLIKELYELHLVKPVEEMQEEINKEKQREETVDWMTRWLKDQAKVFGNHE